MKKTAIALLTIAAGILALSCQKASEPEVKTFEPMTINAVSEGIGTATKTEMAYKYDILWSKDDQIYVTDGVSNDTFTLSAGAGTTKGTFTQVGSTSFSGKVQAYYPENLVAGGKPVWPAVQTNNQTVPMYSSKTVSGKVEDFNFASLGSVLQIVFNTTQENVTLKSIEIKDGSSTLSGAFTVDADGKAVITASDKAGITLDLGAGVALGKAANYFNIAVPSGNYQDLTLVFTATDGKKCTMTGGKVNIAYNAVGRLTLMGEKFKADVPAGALPGVFTVSDNGGETTKQIYFSQGNLYYDGSKFNFEANQYSFKDSWDATYVSHFFWSKDASVACAETYSESGTTGTDVFFTNVDGFKVNVGGKEQSGWRTLSINEWQYLFNTRTMKNGKDRYTLYITYGGKMGLVLYPDDYDNDPISGSVETMPEGVVFLPAAGYRYGSNVNNVGGNGLYWSSAAVGEGGAYYVAFSSSLVIPGIECSRNYGYSVRLITESK